ncbi:TIGR02611 family protein [Mycobacterium bourgelatii]|uniref:TIGR02611 family protein n=1 Tax=Mycobacterium bourgelatii TaxID=1273442 RepID=A0A7I9YXU9_MYCBU|nr:TIGR02611 family protein [Mycobacterium bourgelatii]MCV6972951.1 TIGR02611 family protein [Mycobacterium bourgelatii]GFG93357.1 TIGR02611 family protein [Mycobacterium bourgelatii]
MAGNADKPRGGLRRRLAGARDRLRTWPALDVTYRILVGIVGLALLCVGIIAIPYPGPGWAIVFLGLAVLATEFTVFRRLLKYVRGRYNAVMRWFRRQHGAVQFMGTLLTAAVTVATLWVMGVPGWMAETAGWDLTWAQSPLGFGAG